MEVAQGFLGVDPLAARFSEWSPYNYVLGNPVKLVDPDGKAPTCCGALEMASRDPGLNAVNATPTERREYQMNMGVGFGMGVLTTGAIYVGARTRGSMGFEALSQAVVGMATGKSPDEAVRGIDASDIGMVGIEKLLPGSRVVATLFKMGFSEAVQASVDVPINGPVDILGTAGSKKTGSGTVIETTVGVLAGASGNGVTSVVSDAANAGLPKMLNRAQVELRRSMKGSSGEAIREQSVKNLNNRILRNNRGATVAGATVSESIEHRAKPKN